MEEVVRELSRKYCKSERFIRRTMQIALINNNSLEESKEMRLKFYSS